MNYKELQKRLRRLGISISEGTLRRWASAGLVPRPTTFFKRRKGTPGRPPKTLKFEQPSRGRFTDWPEDVVEQAAAIWAIRNKLQYTRDAATATSLGRRNVPSEIARRVKEEATNLHNLLESDGKAASSLLRTLLLKKESKKWVMEVGLWDEAGIAIKTPVMVLSYCIS